MKKINLVEFFVLPFISYGALFINIKWLSLTCFLFVATMIPVMFWTMRLNKTEPVGTAKFKPGGLIAGIFFLAAEALMVWGYMAFGPFRM
jgi:hypothetical protein